MEKLKMGMIGGGPGAFIGAVHRIAAAIDGEIELVAGAFSSSFEKSKQMGEQLYLQPSRIYESYQQMIEQEAQLPQNERIDFLSIVTPNHLHFAPAKMALEAGFHVVLDKPATFNLEEVKELQQVIKSTGKLSGKFGTIKKIYVEYPQGWLSTPLEESENKQASWRTDPSKSGAAGAMGDIGTHAFNLAEYVSGKSVEQLCADLQIIVPGRKLDDDGAVLLRFNEGASGVLIATQIAAGEENNVKIRVYGEKGGIEWKQEDCNTLLVKWLDKPVEIWRTGTSYVSSFAKHNSRTPSGHPEGYLEAFANHYRNFALCVQAQKKGEQPKAEWLDFPGIEEGVRGMLFIEKVIESGKSDVKWTKMEG
jgi:predicted dehydrogenase